MLQKTWLLMLSVLILQRGYSQSMSTADIEKALADNNTELARQLTEKQLAFYIDKRLPDSIANYIYFTGKITELRSNVDDAVKAVEALIDKIKNISYSPRSLRNAYLEAGEYFRLAGKNNLAYKANMDAYNYGLQVEGISKNELALSQNNLSTCARRMGEVSLAQKHSHEALAYLLSDPKADAETLYNTYNNMGTTLYYSSKYDSAEYYFKRSLDALQKVPVNITNQFYRPAIVYNNLAGIYGVQGKPTDGIRAMKNCLANIKRFIASRESDSKKTSALTLQFEATDNLAGIYKEIGDYRQAHDLLSYSYQQKKLQLGAHHPGVFISEVLLGQLYYAMKEYDKAVQYLNSAMGRMEIADGSHLFWKADACYTLALIHDVKGEEKQAEPWFVKADSLYEATLQGEYDNIYIEFLRNAALYYAQNKMASRAMAAAKKGYDYILKTEGANSLPHFNQLLNFSEIHFAMGDYKQALAFSEKALQEVNSIASQSGTLLDSVLVELRKPRSILLKSKSRYNLLTTKDVAHLTPILTELRQALNILEKRKALLGDPKDIVLMMSDQKELIEFIKTIMLDLYHLTSDERYALDLISLHESAIYNRIRSRLDKSAAQFASLPAELAQKEKALKAAMANALNGQGSHAQVMQHYIRSEENWNQFLNQLRASHPRYYKMRYASIFRPVNEIQSALPPGTTVVRYFFVGNELLAFVVDREQKKLFSLDTARLEYKILSILQFSTNARQSGEILHDLYKQLWLPVAGNIRYNKLVIIPDGILYKLNFEALTSSRISRFEELATASLLAEHTISYQYSFFLIGRQDSASRMQRSYVAFVPGFSDEVKENYKLSRDSMDYDNAYLSLLPQPFTISLAAKTQDLFGGNTFLYDKSTLNSFKKNAGQHKIIYIGTHAEADNLHPEFSKLIFAKDTGKNEENNFLYLFDIYNCDLRSNLSVLTACETGVPGYQDGEGMISLAHAFNYAGSESMITGLWKIDEKTSAVIMELFYRNIEKGMSKDEALRKAKLDYLARAEGRTLSPLYWSGLVLIGDTAPIPFEKQNSWIWIVAAGLLILVALVYFARRRFR